MTTRTAATRTALEAAFIEAIINARQQLAQVESITSFSLTVEATGRVHDGSVNVKFSISSSTYGSNCVTGNSLQAAINELLHRHGWEARHAPLELTFSGEVAETELASE